MVKTTWECPNVVRCFLLGLKKTRPTREGEKNKAARMGQGEEVKTRQDPQVEIQERGEIFFFYRPKVNKEEAHSVDDVQRLYIVMRPESGETPVEEKQEHLSGKEGSTKEESKQDPLAGQESSSRESKKYPLDGQEGSSDESKQDSPIAKEGPGKDTYEKGGSSSSSGAKNGVEEGHGAEVEEPYDQYNRDYS